MSLAPEKKTPNCPFPCLSFPFSPEYPGSSRERRRTAERSSCVPDFFSGPRKQSCTTLHMQTCAPNVAYVEQKVSVGSHGDLKYFDVTGERREGRRVYYLFFRQFIWFPRCFQRLFSLFLYLLFGSLRWNPLR